MRETRQTGLRRALRRRAKKCGLMYVLTAYVCVSSILPSPHITPIFITSNSSHLTPPVTHIYHQPNHSSPQPGGGRPAGPSPAGTETGSVAAEDVPSVHWPAGQTRRQRNKSSPLANLRRGRISGKPEPDKLLRPKNPKRAKAAP